MSGPKPRRPRRRSSAGRAPDGRSAAGGAGSRRTSPGPGGAAKQEAGDPADESADSAWVYGRQPVAEALRAGTVRRLYLLKGVRGPALQVLADKAREAGVPVDWLDRPALDRMTGGSDHQGAAAAVHARALLPLETLLAGLKGTKQALLAVAAGIQDPRNLGALARSAEAAGARGLILPRHRSSGVTPLAMKASAGALAHLPVAEVTNLARSLEALKGEGFWIYGADPDGGLIYHQADLTGRVAVVVGGEGKGMPRLVQERCDALLRIPMRGRVQSLNAAVAGALLLFEAARQLTIKPG